MVSSYTTNKRLEKPAAGDYVNTWAPPINADWDVIDNAFGGKTVINAVSASGTVVLTFAQYRPPNIVISGLLTANVNYQFPTGVGGVWSIYNNTTGAYTITISSGGGGVTQTITQGYRVQVISDGTDISLSQTAPVPGGMLIDGSNVSMTYTQALAFKTAINVKALSGVCPEDFGAVGDGTATDNAAFIAAIATGYDVVSANPAKVYKITADLNMVNSGQKLIIAGNMKFVGNCGVVVKSAAVGVTVDITVDSSGHTGTAIKVTNASRVRLSLYGKDVYNAIYVEEANTVVVEWCWALARGDGLVWYGSDTKRSDILVTEFCLIRCTTAAKYGFIWDGNCNSFVGKYLGLIGGTGTGMGQRVAGGVVIRNTDGITTFPAIGRFEHLEVDYPDSDGIRIEAGLDYDFVATYELGATGSGMYIDASIDDYAVKITAGKFRGNDSWGIENHGGVILYSGNTDLSDNVDGKAEGNVWTQVFRLTVGDDDFYLALDVSDNPLIVFNPNCYLAYDRVGNTFQFIANALPAIVSTGVATAIKSLIVDSSSLIATTTAFANAANANAGTLTNSPKAGNPTKWVPVDDNGTARYVPMW